MSEEEFEAAVGRIERDYEERGADLSDVYAIVNWARSSRSLLQRGAIDLRALADLAFGATTGDA